MEEIFIFETKLQTYLEGNDFSSFMIDFLEGYDYIGRCGKQKYEFYSKTMSYFCKNRIYESSEEIRLQRYFTTIKSDFQLFAVIFSYALIFLILR